MKLNIKEIAKKVTTVAELMENREKGETEDLIKSGKNYTINDCEMCLLPNDEGKEERQWVYTVKELPEKFFFAGHILKKIFDGIVDKAEGDFSAAYAAIQEQGLKVKFGQKKTKDEKRVVTTVELI